MQRTHNRKSVLGDNPFATPEREPREPTPARAKPKRAPAAASAHERPAARPSASVSGKKPVAAKPPPRKAKGKSAAPVRAPKPPEATPLADDTARGRPSEPPAQAVQPLAAPEPEPPVTAATDGSAHEQAEASEGLERKRAVEAKIRELESRIDSMRGDGASHAAGKRSPGGAPKGEAADDTQGDAGVLDTAREMLSSDYYLRQWGRIGMRNRSDVVDEFGYDPTYDARVRPVLEAMYSRYFRAVTEGIEHVPSTGRALIVVNHSGAFPYDGVMLKTAVRKEHPAARDLRWLSEDQIFYLPFVGSFITRLGSVRACQENAERLLANDNLVAVFPEGAKGMGRLYRDRYRLQRFGRGGFIRLCLRTGTPIVPCVIVGAEESMPLMMRIEYLTGPMGLPYLPITPTFPLLGPLGLLPAPTRWSFVFGPPIQLEGYGPESADDHVLVGRLTERVRATMQTMLDRAVSARRSVWFG